MIAMRMQVVAELLTPERGANTAIPGGDNVPMLHHAVRAGNRAIVKLLLAAGAQVDAVDGEGCTAVHALVTGCMERLAELRSVNGVASTMRRVRSSVLLWLSIDLISCVQFISVEIQTSIQIHDLSQNSGCL
jgi:ankyrin repeat protein